MNLTLRQHLTELFVDIGRGYGWVSLMPSWKAGALFLLMTLVNPYLGLFGLIGALVAWYASILAGAEASERPVAVFNGLLAGLFVAHVWAFGVSSLVLLIIGSAFAGWFALVLGRVSSALIGLPILSLPFALIAMMIVAMAGSLSGLTANAYFAPTDLFGNQIDLFLRALSNLFFMSDPFAGLFMLVVLFVFSRYYVLLALLGYIGAWLLFCVIGATPEALAQSAWDSNAILAALLVGGLMARPSGLTALLAIFAAVLAAWLALALGRVLTFVQLVPFSIPFVLAAWLVLYAVVRNMRIAHYFNVHAADFPEVSFERARMSRARVGESGSTSLLAPFADFWTVSQGFSGQHTHKGAWRYALDFVVLKEGKSFANKGNQLSDFYCYAQPVLSPAFGQVWFVVNDVPDNIPGTINAAANWGNYVLIRLYNGQFVLLAHLQQWTVATYAGAWVQPGDLLGYCGNSGRSPQPHIHLHVQVGDRVGAPTLPFHLSNVLIRDRDAVPHYALSVVPTESATLCRAAAGEVRPFYLFAGRGLRYEVLRNDQSLEWAIWCEVDLFGRLMLVSSLGARCFAESTWAVFSCYERSGATDPYFDLWLLANGYTPTSFQVERWQDDAMPAKLLPQTIAKVLSVLVWPWASFLSSDYQRQWDDVEQGWRQVAAHRQTVSGLCVQTESLIQPQLGCTLITASVGVDAYRLVATRAFQTADIGVPAWESTLNLSTSLGRKT